MRRRHPDLPRLWLMTDERLGDALWAALKRLPRGSGVVFRHYGLPAGERRALFAKAARIARRRGLVLIRAGGTPMRGEQGVHNARGPGLRTRSVHSPKDTVRARRDRADLVFVSPVFATRSHPDARALGSVRLGLLSRGNRVPMVALGGMNPAQFGRLRGLKLHGWAGIDAWDSGAD